MSRAVAFTRACLGVVRYLQELPQWVLEVLDDTAKPE